MGFATIAATNWGSSAHRLGPGTLRGDYSGRLFIIGSGPSLRQAHGLEEATPSFAMNRGCYWDGLPTPTFYACNLNKVAQGLAPEEPPYKEHKFLVTRDVDTEIFGGLAGMDIDSERYSDWMPVYASQEATAPRMIAEGRVFYTPGSMALMCIQIGYMLGFREFYLLGCEQTVMGQAFDPDERRHSDDAPSNKHLFSWWRGVCRDLTTDGASIVDCTPGGRLNMEGSLPYRDLAEVLADGS